MNFWLRKNVHDHFSINFFFFTSFKVDGVHTALQNVADLVGFEVGLRAYRKHTQMHGPEKTLEIFKDYDPEKLFTIAFANVSYDVHVLLFKLRV